MIPSSAVVTPPLKIKSCKKCGQQFAGKACRPCANARSAKYYAANKDKHNARTMAWAKANPLKAAASSAKYHSVNSDSHRLSMAAWRKNNPGKNRVVHQNRRARIKAGGGTLSSGLADKLFALQKGRCACCGKLLGLNFHLDHVMPLVLGGANEDSNMQLLTQRCNNQKHAKHPIDFMQSRGFLI